jgi:hypothetical protein
MCVVTVHISIPCIFAEHLRIHLPDHIYVQITT